MFFTLWLSAYVARARRLWSMASFLCFVISFSFPFLFPSFSITYSCTLSSLLHFNYESFFTFVCVFIFFFDRLNSFSSFSSSLFENLLHIITADVQHLYDSLGRYSNRVRTIFHLLVPLCAYSILLFFISFPIARSNSFTSG